MSAIQPHTKVPQPPASCWRLWIDGCGGFLLVTGEQWSVGGLGREPKADICVQSDWPRFAGQIQRQGGDYFWQAKDASEPKMLLVDRTPVPVKGPGVMKLGKPTPLSDTAVLTLNAPHRFDQHVDGVVLVRDTLLVGPGSDCHLRCREAEDRAILHLKANQWYVKSGLMGDFKKLPVGERVMIESLAMTLEAA